MTNRDSLYSILKAVVSDSDLKNLLYEDFSGLYALSINQGVAGTAFQGLRKIMKQQGVTKDDLGTSLPVYKKWLGITTTISLRHDKILNLQNRLSDYLRKAGISALVLKGLSIASYYDDACLRTLGDIDIYSPSDYQRVDDILRSLSSSFSMDYYRHSECELDGIMIENHRFLTDVRGQSRFHKLERFLYDEASITLAPLSVGGLYYPNECFTFIFFVYHALIHFIYEKLSLRFLVDWSLMLKERKDLSLADLDDKLKEFGLMRFASVMTALCIEKLGLQEEYVPNELLVGVKEIDQKWIDRFEADLFMQDYEGFSTNSLKDRIKRGKEFYKKRWKIEEFLGVSTTIFLLEKVCALFRCKV